MSTLKLDTLSNTAGTKSVPTNTVVDGSAKAWVNFNGTGTVAIRKAFNVSSITDNGTADYTVNLTSAFADANYVMVGSCSNPADASNSSARAVILNTAATGTCRIVNSVGTGAATDFQNELITFFR